MRRLWVNYRPEAIWSALALALAVALAFVPLFNVLGYELAEVYCLFVTVAAGAICIHRINDETFSLGDGELGRAFLGMSARATMPLLAPFILMLLNALRVPNCDLQVGVLLYLLLPVASVPVASAMALAVGTIVKRPGWRWVGYYGLIVLSIATGCLHLATEPTVFAYHPTIGYFAGSIYDEALAVPRGLVPFRLYCLCLVVVVLSGLTVGRRWRAGASRAAPVTVMLLALCIGGALYAERFELGFESNREDIIGALGGRAESEHFVIYYALSDRFLASRIDDIVADHEFRWHQLETLFGVSPPGPLYSFIYSSREEKFRLMGAGRTLIAKPWLGEFHITYDEIGDGHMAHEMAHLFTAAFGSGPLRLAGRGLVNFDVGLVEGAAEAGAWDGAQLTYHGWSAALLALDLAPEPQEVIGVGGFWTNYSRTVYTLMGSFCRWLIDHHGAARFREVYGTGDFEASYGRPLDSLVSDWWAFLEAIELTEEQLAIARWRYDRPSIFGKRCARSVAERVDRGRALATARRFREAADCFLEVVEDDPDNLQNVLMLATFLRQAGDLDAARDWAEAVLDRDGAGRVMRAQARELRGDIAWSAGDLAGAAAAYELVSGEPLPADDARRVAVKLAGVQLPGLEETVRALFIDGSISRDVSTVLMVEGADVDRSGVLDYLLGVRLYNAGDFARSGVSFSRAITRLPTSGVLNTAGGAQLFDRARLRYAQTLFFEGRVDEARRRFEALSVTAEPLSDAFAREARDWAERCEWTAANGAR